VDSPHAPPLRGSLPPEGAAPALGRPGGGVDGASDNADSLAARFDAVRESVISAPRDRAALALEIGSMRDKVRAAHPVKGGMFDVKHSAGGMVDVEFVVQYLVLAHSADHPELLGNVGNIALLVRAEAVGLLHRGVGLEAADAYRELRHIQHRARLDESPTQIDAGAAEALAAAVQRLWHHAIGTPLGAGA